MMFSLIKTLSILAVASSAMASPMARYRRQEAAAVNVTSSSEPSNRTSSSSTSSGEKSSGIVSFDNWRGISSLNNFDGFFGSDNFDGRRNQEVIIIEQQQVCSRRDVIIIQQQLSIIEEFAKRVLLEQLCDVETQVIVLEQFRGRMRDFRRDLRRQSGRSVSFDSNISLLINDLVNSDGSLNNKNFGFNGRDIGQHSRTIGGSNWDDSRSPQNINDILNTIASSVVVNPSIVH